MNYDNLIKELLVKRGLETERERVQFLHPTLDAFHNPFLLNNMSSAVERIKTAIENKEKIVIYGDYDCDGISAVSILYLYFKSVGLDAVGFIPSRHTDGYGLSETTVNKIKTELNPNLVITVDTGISAYKEIELFKNLGVDVIVTDHHEPPEVIPNTIVIDPKIKGQDYPFNGLSGAGVAFKLVQALSDLNTALEYVDIACISTVGDIVPLLDENRIIVKLGLEKINSKTPRPSIGFLLSKLNLKKVTSLDISFKIVPRINACGRISSAGKCFNFMVATSGTELEKYYAQMEEDNNLRLDLSNEIFKEIDEQIKDINLNKEKAVFVRNDSFNLGLIGIIASKLVGQLNRPVFIFTSSEDGNLKASVRSIDGIDIFQILDKHRDLMVDVGGHSLAGGLTVTPQNYEKLKETVLNDLKDVNIEVLKYNKNAEFDAEIKPSDINMKLASKIDDLEPFGFGNPRPTFKISTNTTNYKPLKSIKHFKIELEKNVEVVSFFGDKLVPAFKTDANKDLVVTVEVDNYFSRPRAKAMLKNLSCTNYKFSDEQEYKTAKEIYYYSLIDELKPVTFAKDINFNQFGTLIITDEKELAEKFSNNYGYKIEMEPLLSGESIVLYNPHRAIELSTLSMYKDILVLNSLSLSTFLAQSGKKVVNQSNENIIKLGLNREIYKNCYVYITKNLPVLGNNLFEIVEQLDKKKYSPTILTLTILVALELGFYEITETDGVLKLVANISKDKKSLEQSKIFNYFK